MSYLRANDQVAPELDSLGHTIDRNGDSLRHAAFGRNFSLEGFKFRLIKRDKNHVYVVRGQHEWFLKLPVQRDRLMMRRESFGSELASSIVSACPGYREPAGLLINEEHGYTLVGAIPGWRLNILLYLTCFNPIFDSHRSLQQTFRRLGVMLATIHSAPIAPGAPQSDRGLSRLFNASPSMSRVERELQPRVEQLTASFDAGEPVCIVHGNARMDNVIAVPGALTLIDFENCGLGSPYDDLSIITSQLRLLSSLMWFPTGRSKAMLDAFVEGYAELRSFDEGTLNRAVALRMVHYYCGFTASGKATMAGIPVVGTKLRSLVLNALA